MIKVGDTIPAGSVTVMASKEPKVISTSELFDNKRVVLFGVPGAFTPTCTAAHLPGYVVHVDELKAKGIDTVACLSVNDIFVLSAWAQSQNADQIEMLADGNADFVTALGLQRDMRDRGFGIRSERFAMVASNGVVEYVAKESIPKELQFSSAEKVLTVI